MKSYFSLQEQVQGDVPAEGEEASGRSGKGADHARMVYQMLVADHASLAVMDVAGGESRAGVEIQLRPVYGDVAEEMVPAVVAFDARIRRLPQGKSVDVRVEYE